MCYYLGYDVKKIKHVRIREHELEYGKTVPLRPIHSGFAYEDLEIIRAGTNMLPECARVHWEFIPFWIKNSDELKASRKKGIPTLNATAEKLLSSKLFKQAALHQRCILPVSFFYEWRHVATVDVKKPDKIPYCIAPEKEDYLLLAGIWQPWTDQQTGETLDTFAIVTTQANAWMAQIHNSKKRMPLICTQTQAEQWISPDLTENELRRMLDVPCTDVPLHAWTIHKNFKVLDQPTEAEGYDIPPIESYSSTLST